MTAQVIRQLLAAGLWLLAPTLQAQQWVSVESADRPITVTASGMVGSAATQRFGPPPSRSWRINIAELASEGTRVKQGDVLAKFDASGTDDRIRELSGQLNAKRSELESQLETQSREIEEEKVRLADARSKADKAARKASQPAELYASLEYQKLLEERDLMEDLLRREQARSELTARVRQARVAELEADIRRLESELNGAQRELESFTVRATGAGVVIVGTNQDGQKLDVNESVNPGMVVVEVADDSRLVIHAEVPEFTAAHLAVGQRALVVIDAIGTREIEAEVTDVASIVRRQSKFSQAMVRDVTVSLDDDVVSGLRPGMSAKVSIVTDTRKDALAIPPEALVYRNGRPGVLKRGDGWQEVSLGEDSQGMRIVVSGIDSGDEVALQ
jgi:HlyD family secretion protein